MDNINTRLQEDLKKALRDKNELELLTLRSLLAAIQNKSIELGKKEEGLDKDETESVVLSEIKKRADAQKQYEDAKRQDLAEIESSELEILERYAPKKMSQDEIIKIVDDIINETEASGMKDLGVVMKGVMSKTGKGADGSLVSSLVRERLEEN